MSGEPTVGPAYAVVVTVGTDHHPFDRLVGWIDRWAAVNPEVAVLVQHGTAAAPAHGHAVAMIGYDELVAAMAGARVVVAQGGPAAIMDARSVGHRPVVVPRRHSLGEHVDDHQVRFTAWMDDHGHVTLAADETRLAAMLDEAMADPDRWRIAPDSGDVAETIANFRAAVEPLLDRGSRRAAPALRLRLRLRRSGGGEG